MRKFTHISILFCLTAIILGAFGAHLLKDVLNEVQVTSFETGVRYQMFHGLAILMISLNKEYFTNKLSKVLQIMSLGVILFSVSIYLLNIQGLLGLKLNILGPVTALGGIFLIVSWGMLFFIVKKNRFSSK